MAAKETKDSSFVSPALSITAKRDGFRRAGIAHPAQATDHKAGAFDLEQYEALKADPSLVVVEKSK